jgi:amino acid transporter
MNLREVIPHSKQLGKWPLALTMYFVVSGGPYSLEKCVQGGPGFALLLIVLVPLLFALPVALMSAELTSAIPEEGGYYAWIKRALGSRWAFVAGFWAWAGSWIDLALYPMFAVAYFKTVVNLPLLDQPMVSWCIVVALTGLVAAVNIRGIKSVGFSSSVLTWLVMGLFAIVTVLGLVHAAMHPVAFPMLTKEFSWGTVSTALYLVLWNYTGWDSLAVNAGEIQDPRRNYPWALTVCLGLVTIGYFLPLLAGIENYPNWSKWDDSSWPDVAGVIGGASLRYAVGFVGVASLIGLYNTSFLTITRVPLVLSEDRYLPKSLTKLHRRFGTPWICIVITAILAGLFALASIGDLLAVDITVSFAVTFLEFISLAVLRKKEPNLERPFIVPGGWLGLSLVTFFPTAILLVAGYARLHSKEAIEQMKRLPLPLPVLIGAVLAVSVVFHWVIERRRMGRLSTI